MSGLRHPASQAFLLASVLIVLFAVLFRIHHIGQRSLWFDEALAANISRGTLAETLTLTRYEHSAPITHPLILYVVERVTAGPLAVRGPSLVASVLAVVLMLCFVTIPSIDPKTAALSALMLSLSATQIRYAQEVREYSLSVLYAALLAYLFLAFTENHQKHNSPVALYLALFAAPLMQYGMVLFSCGILAALFILKFTYNHYHVRISQILMGALFWATGSLTSFMLTLRYQWGAKAFYLKDYYFIPGSSLLHFSWSNSHDIFKWLMPGRGALWISAIAIIFYLGRSFRARLVTPLIILAFTTFGTVLLCAILGVYPYGPIRQCLFLAPVLCLLAATSLVQIANRVTGVLSKTVFAAITCVVLVSGVSHIRYTKPYAEIEDIQKVLVELWNHLKPGEGVYIYAGAVPAVDFYVKERDPRFTYGHFHRKAPKQYIQDLLACLPQGASTTWIVFSHIVPDGEDQRILRDLTGEWEVEPTVLAKGTALYQAHRRSAVDELSNDHEMAYADPSRAMLAPTPATGCARESFWDWNKRLMTSPGQ